MDPPDRKTSYKNKNTKKNDNDKEKVGEKKPFDKKKYRLKKYSNKYKVDQWEEKRKKAVLRGFYKELHKDEKNNPIKPAPETSESGEQSNKDLNLKRRPNAFFAAKKEFQKKQDEKRKQKEEILKSKSEREEALNKYKEKRIQNYKKLSKKTKKGQPIMKDRLEMLLEKIQQTT